MKEKHVPFLIIGLLVFSFVVVKVESSEPPLGDNGTDFYLKWEVRAPEEVQIGEEFSVIFNFEPASTWLDITNVNVTLYGVIGSGGAWDYWKDSWNDMRMHSEVIYTKTAYFTAEKEGGVYGTIYARYLDANGEHHSLYVNLGITQIQQSYEELENDYDSLNQSYSTLQENYDSLEINLSQTRTMSFAFIITAIVFIATTVIFAVRKPKSKSTT